MNDELLLKALDASINDSSLPHECRRFLRERAFELLMDSPRGTETIVDASQMNTDNFWWFRKVMESAGKTWPDKTLWPSIQEKIDAQVAKCRADLDAPPKAEKPAQQPAPKPAKVIHRPQRLSATQQEVWTQLNNMAEVYYDRGWAQCGIQPRIQPLIVAPSGAGKSHLVQSFADWRSLQVLRLSYAEWMPRGCRIQPDTATRVHQFLQDHERCVIFIDELDKMQGFTNEWSTSILNEAFLLLDRSLFRPGFSRSPEADLIAATRLKEGTFIIGAGTWQHVWSKQARPLGFGGASTQDTVADIANSRQIPEELLRRFSGTLLSLPPASADELRQLAQADDLEAMASKFGIALDYLAGAASGRGWRWFEDQRLKIELGRMAARSRTRRGRVSLFASKHLTIERQADS